MALLLSLTDLPEEFSYPPFFIRVVGLGLTNLEPWWIIEGDVLLMKYQGLRKRYPTRRLIPFARRQDNDDVACWDLELARGGVVIIHDFAEPGWERREEMVSFENWLRRAVEDLIEFE
ncbi:hypothetical protein [uncultured Friedmanniella sp.]|uniref:hypothetical protein n=1 Tax=uncultured Friedmanniella sp. TaxID=335381 RepID=UPI0035CACFD1